MVDLKAILNTVPTIQAASLAHEGYKLSKGKKKHLNLVGYGTKAIVGTALIKTESDLIGGI